MSGDVNKAELDNKIDSVANDLSNKFEVTPSLIRFALALLISEIMDAGFNEEKAVDSAIKSVYDWAGKPIPPREILISNNKRIFFSLLKPRE